MQSLELHLSRALLRIRRAYKRSGQCSMLTLIRIYVLCCPLRPRTACVADMASDHCAGEDGAALPLITGCALLCSELPR